MSKGQTNDQMDTIIITVQHSGVLIRDLENQSIKNKSYRNG